jgi:hypothetical protein
MPAEIKKEIELEIGHVLFIDIVGRVSRNSACYLRNGRMI